jgi:hypothetical protein
MDTTSCVWDGPDCLKQTPRLFVHYPEHRELFWSVLGIRDADLSTLATEAQQLSISDSLTHISDLLIAISRFLEIHKNPKKVSRFASYAMFPVHLKRRGSTQVSIDLKTASDSDEWYIADLERLGRSFDGKLNLLAIDQDTRDKIKPLIRALRMERRLLSRSAHGIPVAGGSKCLDVEYTASFKRKAKYISL